MEGRLATMTGAQERFTDTFIAMVERFNSDSNQHLGEHVSSLDDAQRGYFDSLEEVLAKFNRVCGPIHNKVPDDFVKIGIKGFKKELFTFFAYCSFPNPTRMDDSRNAGMMMLLHSVIPNLIYAARDCKETVTYMLTRFNDLSGHQIDSSVFEFIDRMDERFIGACSNLIDALEKKMEHFFPVLAQRARDWMVAVQNVLPDAIEAAPVRPDDAQPRDRLVLPSEAQGDMGSDILKEEGADVSEECKTAVSQALPDLDLNSTESEETMERKMVATQVLLESDPNERA